MQASRRRTELREITPFGNLSNSLDATLSLDVLRCKFAVLYAFNPMRTIGSP
jgi:hypothetical protein